MCARPESGPAGLARQYRAKPSRCFASTQPKGSQLRAYGGSGREEAGRAPRPRRPRSQGQLHSSLQTVTSSPAHPSPAPLPPPHNCLLHLSEGAAETRRRPAASGDFPRLLALGEPPRSLGRGRRTVHFVLPTTSLGSDLAAKPFPEAVQDPSPSQRSNPHSPPTSRVPVIRVPPDPCVLS